MIPVRDYLMRALDFVWPRICPICERVSDRPRRFVCSDCVNRLPFISVAGCCRRCGRAVEGLTTDYICADCFGSKKPAFDRAGSALRYEPDVRQLVHDYKFRRCVWLRDDLSDWLIASTCARFDVARVDLVVPMPTTLYHRLDRGYNQCAFLAKKLAKELDRPYRTNILRRIGSPKRQSELSEEERRENAINTFAVRAPQFVRGRTVLIVDDIMTTGSTLSDAARALKEASAWRVWCTTLARSLREA